MKPINFCQSCFEKQKKIDRLEEKIQRLEAQLKSQKVKTAQGYFGSSTPSSKQAFKKNSQKEKDMGGAKKGHKGNGRASIKPEEASRIEEHPLPDECPICGGKLESKGNWTHSVKDTTELKPEKIIHEGKMGWCPKCKKSIKAKIPVLPKSLYGNNLIAQALCLHFLDGVPVGRVESILDLEGGNLFEIFPRIAALFDPLVPKIIADYRRAEVKHADETGWRIDGDNAYSWLFCSETESIFRFEETRSGMVPLSIFGKEKLPGILVVDRYAGYNRVPCEVQYCYAHLLRTVEDLEKEFPDSGEIRTFVANLAPVLSESMKLRSQDISDSEYYDRALKLKHRIIELVNAPANHIGIKNIQLIFLENQDKLYHWVKNRKVPPDNNRCERELRPTVIARKVSFGSQSNKGAHTRSVLMTILHTARKRLKSKPFVDWVKSSLDKIALCPSLDIASILPIQPVL